MSTPNENVKGKEFWTAQTQGTAWHKAKTKFKISLPPGENIKLLSLAEISAPGGVSFELRLPFPMSEAGLGKLGEAIRNAGGTIEIGY